MKIMFIFYQKYMYTRSQCFQTDIKTQTRSSCIHRSDLPLYLFIDRLPVAENIQSNNRKIGNFFYDCLLSL